MTSVQSSAIQQTEAYLAKLRPLILSEIDDVLGDIDSEPLLDSLMRAYPSRPAKGLRPALCLAVCRAFGGDDLDVLPSAVAIELLHNMFLVHDDITDVSETRRGLPTLYTEVGVPLALTATGGLGAVAFLQLHRNYERLGTGLSSKVAREFSEMLIYTLNGQAQELQWIQEATRELTPSNYLSMVVNKTCWYTTIHPIRVGAMIGSWDSVDLDRFVEFGVFLGAAFQVQDDLLNLYGDEVRYGKELLGDLREGKRTLMLLHLIETADGADEAVVAEYLRCGQADRPDDMIGAVRDLMVSYGSLSWAEAYASKWAERAAHTFDAAFIDVAPSEDLDFVHGLITYMLQRDR